MTVLHRIHIWGMTDHVTGEYVDLIGPTEHARSGLVRHARERDAAGDREKASGQTGLLIISVHQDHARKWCALRRVAKP